MQVDHAKGGDHNCSMVSRIILTPRISYSCTIAMHNNLRVNAYIQVASIHVGAESC